MHRWWTGVGVFVVMSPRWIELILLVKRLIGCRWMGYSWMGCQLLEDECPVRPVHWLSHCPKQSIHRE